MATEDTVKQSPREELHAAILADLQSRVDWERKQADFYRMRHTGIARKNKPWNNAADLHFPLCDTNIEKLKPLFFQQIVGMDVVATFVPMCQQLAAATASAAQWFDYRLRECSNLQDEALSWIDYALMSGRGVMKVTWDSNRNRLSFASIDPLYLIVPPWTKDLQEADRIVHVMPMSKSAYTRAGIYQADGKTLDKILGGDDEKGNSGANHLENTRRTREGLTHDSKREKIIVWEVYEQRAPGDWVVRTYSPTAPEIDLRAPMALPFDHGMAPFVDFAYEIKDRGWYSPRGITEILAPFEASLCHTWNQKHDSMQLFNKPVFRSERDVPNTMNLRMGPGQILPNGLVPVTMPQPPLSFDQEMVSIRSIAEQRVANPDYGIGQVINTSNRRTATEIEAVGAQSQQAGDLRARVFRMALGRLYKMAWELLLQFDREDLAYRFQDDALEVSPDALHGRYHIEPKGGVNEVNKQFLLQKAVQRKQLFAQSAWINQPELDRCIMELDDPGLVKRLFQDPHLKDQNETADEMRNIPALLVGAPIPVRQGDNYSLRVGVLMQFLQNAQQTGKALPPDGVQAMVGRLEALLQADAQVDNNGAKALQKSVGDFLRAAGYIGQPAPRPPAQLPGAAA